jgi:hypothetical protein
MREMEGSWIAKLGKSLESTVGVLGRWRLVLSNMIERYLTGSWKWKVFASHGSVEGSWIRNEGSVEGSWIHNEGSVEGSWIHNEGSVEGSWIHNEGSQWRKANINGRVHHAAMARHWSLLHCSYYSILIASSESRVHHAAMARHWSLLQHCSHYIIDRSSTMRWLQQQGADCIIDGFFNNAAVAASIAASARQP